MLAFAPRLCNNSHTETKQVRKGTTKMFKTKPETQRKFARQFRQRQRERSQILVTRLRKQVETATTSDEREFWQELLDQHS